MCGITGVIKFDDSITSNLEVVRSWETLFQESLRRGSDASGVMAVSNSKVFSYKRSGSTRSLLNDERYLQIREILLDNSPAGQCAILGHSRLGTNGSASLNLNNQPVISEDMVLLHNGIIVNDSQIKIKFDLPDDSQLDTETASRLFSMFGVSDNPVTALKQVFSEIKGNSTFAAILRKRNSCLLATNNGSLYFLKDAALGLLLFSSEPKFLVSALRLLKSKMSESSIRRLEPNTAVEIPFGSKDFEAREVRFAETDLSTGFQIRGVGRDSMQVTDFAIADLPNFRKIPRCLVCVLPETFPNIDFDVNGVCRYCREKTSDKSPSLGQDALLRALGVSQDKFKDSQILVGVSGGRDSCYGLHYLKNVLNLDVVAYTYDWGMVTDLARRNIARVCGDLGIEHIIIAPNTSIKLRNVKLNLLAWQKKPVLGMIPLLMAGDKQFYLYAHKLRKERGTVSTVLCAGNKYETTDFKVAFSGVTQKSTEGVLRDTTTWQSLSLLRFYFFEALKNPRYLNRSLIDTISAFRASYFLKDDYVYLFKYIEWDEQEILETLRDKYGWEDATDTTNTWRIGDGTAAFYNYVYYSVAGFTESDTFRSHQVRAGAISRDQALEFVSSENTPRFEALQWYANKVGVSLEELLKAVHSMKKLWL